MIQLKQNKEWRKSMSNDIYRAIDVDSLMADNQKALLNIISDFVNEKLPRLEKLDAYYNGQNDTITGASRRRDENKADNRAAHPFAEYIADFQTAYSVGKPVTLSFKEDSDNLDPIIQGIDKYNETDTLNYKLFLDSSKYGRAVEEVYYGEDENYHFVRLDPKNSFIIYSTDLVPKSLASVRINAVTTYGASAKITYYYEIYTEKNLITATSTTQMDKLNDVEVKSNPMGIIPVFEYQNNDDRFGDYEKVIPLIDLYDAAESDTANYMQDFNDALLLISGDIENLDMDEEKMQDMLDMNMLSLQSGKDIEGRQTNVGAQYLTKSMDSVSAEAYKKRLATDIHKFSKTPQYTDSDFANNVSGVAMQYKLLGTVEMAEIKRRNFARGLQERYTILSKLMVGEDGVGGAGMPLDLQPDLGNQVPKTWNIKKLAIKFTDNLPQDMDSTVNRVVQLSGTISRETQLDLLSGVLGFDTDEELTRLENDNGDTGYELPNELDESGQEVRGEVEETAIEPQRQTE